MAVAGRIRLADGPYVPLPEGSPGNGLVIPRAKSDLGKKYSRYNPHFLPEHFQT